MAYGLVELEIEYQRLVAEASQYSDAAERGDPVALAKYKEIAAKIRVVISQIEQLQRAQVSSGDIVREDQAALAPNANPQDPSTGIQVLANGRIQPPPETTAGSNALKIPSSQNTGINGELRPLTQTQSTLPGSNGYSSGPVSEDQFRPGGGVIVPGGQIGIGDGNDDRGNVLEGTPGTNTTVSSLNKLDFTDFIQPSDNVLDQYASYSYQISLYLIDAPFYQKMINTGQKNLSGANLIVSSGGAGAGAYDPYAASQTDYGAFGEAPTGPTGSVGGGGSRNKYFTLDYYIDDIELKSFIVGRGVRLSHNVKEIKFKVIEPNGITFIQNLSAAVNEYIPSAGNSQPRSFASQQYLMVIRFYGYDAQGNLVRGGVNKNNQTSDPNAFIEKWYPLLLTKVHFRIANKAVEYDIEAKAPPYFINASQGRGTIPYNVELSGQTLKDILAGPTIYAGGQTAVTAGGNSPATQAQVRAIDNATIRTNSLAVRNVTGRENGILGKYLTGLNRPTLTEEIIARSEVAAAAAKAPPKADVANTVKGTVRTGLLAALNKFQQDAVIKEVYEWPDIYEIEFADDSLANAKIVNPAGLNKSATSMSTPGTASDQKLPSKQSMDPNSRVSSATAGMQIVQFLDLVIRNSTYMKDQQTMKINENTGELVTTGINLKQTAWFKVGFQATPLQWDNKRNDYAYRIKYIVSPYKIVQLNSPYYAAPTYNGVHKRYRYWFTGQNTQVLGYEENFNNLYYIIMSNANKNGGGALSKINSLVKYQYQTASGQSSMGGDNNVNEPAANAADQLYSISDLKEATVTIVGDPAWLQQGESWVHLKKGDPYYYSAFLKDGTINFDSQQILFEISYNTPNDYNLETGLLQPNYGNMNTVGSRDTQLQRLGSAAEVRTYIAKEVHSHFTKGKFTQTLKGTLMIYNPPDSPDTGRTAPTSTKASDNAAQTQTKAPNFAKTLRSTVTNPTPSSSLAKGTEALLHPTYNGNLTDNQLLSTPAYIQAKLAGKSGTEALAIARAASQNGQNDYRGSILPGIVDTSNNQYIVKDR